MSLANRILGMVVALATMCMAVPPAHASSMFLSPSFSVTQSGAAAMSIPFHVAPGVAGMQPSIGLAYNSQNSNGIVGVGWAISGLSAIARCRMTQGQDGAREMGASASSDSRFCLDGQRLVLTNGTYGADGSVYRLEIDDQTKIVAYGNLNSKGPLYFKVWHKSGTIVEYGTSDSLFADVDRSLSTAVPVLWSQSRVLDRNGNYVDYLYSNDYTNKEQRISEIRYTGNIGAALAPQNRVTFTYGGRTDAVRQYHNGYLIQAFMRLTQVQMLQQSIPFLTYSLGYASSQESKLTQVQGCAPSGLCWPAVQFGWGAPTTFGSMGVSAPDDLGYPDGRQWADVNGDGIGDYCRIVGDPGTYRAWCTLGTSSGLSSTTLQSGYLDPGATYGRAFVDFNGDGLADFCRIIGSAGSQQLTCTLSTGSSFGSTITSAVAAVAADGSWVDFDGDGRIDYCRTTGSDASTDGRVVCTFSAGSSFGATNTSLALTIGDGMRQYIDINGDGFADFCRLKIYGPPFVPNQVLCNVSNGAIFATSTPTSLLAFSTSEFGLDAGRQWTDINGDGSSDFCRVVSAGGTQVLLKCNLGNGAGGFQGEVVSLPVEAGVGEGRQWTDVNGDGLADFCRTAGVSTTGQISCTLSTGGAFGGTITSPTMDMGYFTNFRVWRDVAAGGGSGYCAQVGTGNQIACTPITTGDRRIVTVSTQGVSAPSHTITYASLTSGVHTKGSGAVYPQIDAQIPLQVVSQVQVADGAGGVRTSNYTYGGLRLEANTGRGTLGMNWQHVLDVDTNVKTESLYFQNYPFTGLPSAVVRKLNGAKLAESNSWYSYRSFTGSTQDGTPSVGPGKYYQLLSDRKLDLTWEIGGAFKSGSSIKQLSVDVYGNVGAVLTESTDAAGNATGWSKQATSSYSNDTTNWILGRVTRTTVAAGVPNTIPATGVGSDPLAGTVNGTPFRVPYRGRPGEIADFIGTILLPIITD
jgi:hypothetical protein